VFGDAEHAVVFAEDVLQPVAHEFEEVAVGGHHLAGEEIWLEATYLPIQNGLGQTLRIMKIATDITAQIEA
ncbi:hypothetical protein R0G64_32315, partial [Pseudomonas otitidis]